MRIELVKQRSLEQEHRDEIEEYYGEEDEGENKEHYKRICAGCGVCLLAIQKNNIHIVSGNCWTQSGLAFGNKWYKLKFHHFSPRENEYRNFEIASGSDGVGTG